MAKKDNANVKIGKPFEKEIELTLDEESVEAQRRKLVDIDNRLLAKEGEKSVAASGFNAELKAIRKERETCLGAINSGCLTEKIEVREHMHLESGQVEIRRVDNGEVVGTREMTDAERQTEMFADPKGDNGKNDGSSATVGDLAAARAAKKKSSKKSSKKPKGDQPEA